MSRCRKPNGRFKSCAVGHRRGGGQRVEAAATAYRSRLQAYAAREDAKSFRPEGARASHPRGC